MDQLHFKNIPPTQLIAESLRLHGILNYDDKLNLKLFKFSSYNPVILVSIHSPNNNTSHIVARGGAEICGSLVETARCTLESEVSVIKILGQNKIRVPKLLLDGKILTIKYGQDKSIGLHEFNYFLMSFVPGIAIDNAMRIAMPSAQRSLVSKIAAIYAKIHSIKGGYFGRIKAQNFNNKQVGFLAYLIERGSYYSQYISGQKSVILKNILNPYEDYKKSSYKILEQYLIKYPKLNEATLVIFDGSAGNMLVDNDQITLIDFDRSLYSCPLFDFCATLYCLEWYFFDVDVNDEKWQEYLASYRNFSGWLPDLNDFDEIFPHIFIDFLMSSAIDGVNHVIERKREAALNMFIEINNLISDGNLNTKKLVRSIRAIKNY